MGLLKWIFGKNGSDVIEPAIYVGQVYWADSSRYMGMRYQVTGPNTYKLKIVDRNSATDEVAYDSWVLVGRLGTDQRRWVPLKKNRWVNPREPMGLFYEINGKQLVLGEEGWHGHPCDDIRSSD